MSQLSSGFEIPPWGSSSLKLVAPPVDREPESLNLVPIRGECAFGIVTGGSGSRVALLGRVPGEMSMRKLPWPELRRRYGGQDIKNAQDFFIDELSKEAVELIRENRVDLRQIVKWGTSIAGPVNGKFVTTTNTGVDFNHFPFAERFQQRFIHHLQTAGYTELPRIFYSPEDFLSLNDARAGALGEFYHPEGGLVGVSSGMFIILGTGFGGALIRDGRIIAPACEVGHIVLYDTNTKKYQVKLLDELENLGWFNSDSGKYFDQNMGSLVFVEHLLAGAFLGPSVVQKTRQFGAKSCDKLAAAINEYHEYNNLSDRVDVEVLDKMAGLLDSERGSWALKAHDPTTRAVLRWVMSLEPDDSSAACKIKGHPYPELVKFGYTQQKEFLQQVGLVLRALYKTFGRDDPNFKFVIGGGLGESLKGKTTALRLMHKVMTQNHLHSCGPQCEKQLAVSKLEGEQRELTGLMSSPGDPWVKVPQPGGSFDTPELHV